MPVSGGIYDQDPRLLTEYLIISEEVAKVRNSEVTTTQSQMNGFEDPKLTKTYSPPTTRPKSFVSEKVGGLNFKRVPKLNTRFQRLQNK